MKRIIIKQLYTESDVIEYLSSITEFLASRPSINLLILDGLIPKVLSYTSSNVDFAKKFNVA